MEDEALIARVTDKAMSWLNGNDVETKAEVQRM